MSIDMYVYVGPYAKITIPFGQSDIPDDLCDRLTYCEGSDGTTVSYIISNSGFGANRPMSYERDAEHKNPTLEDPDFARETRLFLQAHERDLAQLDVPYTIHWGVFAYYG